MAIMAQSGSILVRPTGHILATDCGASHCSPCITNVQNAAQVALAGSCGDFYTCGLVDMLPAALQFCEAWEQWTWAGNCCWIWAGSVDISQWTAPGWLFKYVLVLRYAPIGFTVEFQDNHTDNVRPPGFSAEIYCGADYEGGDLCDWMVTPDPLFVSTAGGQNTIQCGPDGKLHGVLALEGRNSGWGGGDATGYTATITLP